ncbi:MAG: ankyrin repeat domain-containing protein [Pyrinomonadaceae bacterium]|nr:ankyrin repeat domain-containing protein [Pyrinomonadaceae bacterium]
MCPDIGSQAGSIGQIAIAELFAAASKGDFNRVQAMLYGGASILDADNHLGQMTLMLVIKAGRADLVFALINRGVNVNRQTRQGETALALSKARGLHEITRLLKGFGLWQAARDGDLPSLKLMLAEGADVKAMTSDGWTALSIAALKGYQEIMHALLKNGADANARNGDGWTPLMLATSLADIETIEILLSAGADPNLQDQSGWTALMQAVAERNVLSAQALLAAGADVCVMSAAGETALLIASQRGYAETVELLEHYGAKRLD